MTREIGVACDAILPNGEKIVAVERRVVAQAGCPGELMQPVLCLERLTSDGRPFVWHACLDAVVINQDGSEVVAMIDKASFRFVS